MKNMNELNPFICGAPVRGGTFFDRKRELRRLLTAVRKGESVILVAEPRAGKTSLLFRLQEEYQEIADTEASHVILHYLDGQTMTTWGPPRFWREALEPLRSISPTLKESVARAERHHFDNGALGSLFHEMESTNHRLILLLDEFDALQNIPALHSYHFYGPLRSLASRYVSLSLIAASRRSTTDLNAATRDFATGSPYFNFAQEIMPAPFPERAIGQLLARGGSRFSPQDRRFLRRIGGLHPYFLQAAAFHLWEWSWDDTLPPEERRRRAALDLHTSIESVLSDIWQAWTPYMQMAFTLVTLESIPYILPDRTFDIQALLHDLPTFSPELRKLARRGFLRQDEKRLTGYAPQAEVMVWYLADELTRVLRPHPDLKTWLFEQQWAGLLKKGERKAMTKALRKAGEIIKDGVEAFIKAAAEGMGQRLLS